MQWKGKGIAILARDHCEDPELWEILWRAVLAPDDQQDTQSYCAAPQVRELEKVADSSPGAAGEDPKRRPDLWTRSEDAGALRRASGDKPAPAGTCANDGIGVTAIRHSTGCRLHANARLQHAGND